jgi:putative hydrolase of the HAD superfamily
MKHREVVVLADADNTLWDTDARFATAQLRLLEVVESHSNAAYGRPDRLDFVRSYDQALAIEHHLHLRYPVRMLADALAIGLCGGVPVEVAKALVNGTALTSSLSEIGRNEAAAAYMATLNALPELLPGVLEGLELAKEQGVTVYILTEGNADTQRKILKHHVLSELISGVSEVTKNEAQFARFRRRYPDSEIAVIGDQPSRDITPAHAAGCTTVLVPSRFRPSWAAFDGDGGADYVATDFLRAIRWLLSSEKARP